MKLFRFLKLNKERGSATIEAIIAFSGFLFVIFTILNVVNYCSAQMLISNAVDTATKELTQYAYFYKMSGLQKFSEDMSNVAEVGAGNINDILATTDSLYQSIGTAVDNTAEHSTNILNAIESGTFNQQMVQNVLTNIEADGTNISTSIESIMEAFGSVQDNPILYMKSIVAIAGNEGLDALKSHIIAAPLAKMFIAKHFGETIDEASKELERIGVVGGIDGMNFNMSTIFSSDAPNDVHIVVYYKLKLVQIFDWASLEVTLCKESRAMAWLGGDDVQAIVKPIQSVQLPDDGNSESGANDNTETEDSTEEMPEENQEIVDIEGSYWHLGDGGYGAENAGRNQAFLELFNETYNIDTTKPGWYSQQKDSRDEYTGNIYYHECRLDLSTYSNVMCDFYFGEAANVKRLIDDGFVPEETNSLTYVLYVPENISDEEYMKTKEKFTKAYSDYVLQRRAMSEEAREEYANIAIHVEIVKAGGNYDYGSEE